MAEKVKFRRGLSTDLPAEKVAGTFLVETDTGTMYVDDSTTSRVQIKDSTKVSYIESQTLTDAQKQTARNNIDADSKVVVTFNFSVSPATITDPEGYDGAKILADIQAGKSVYAKVNKTGSAATGAVLPYYSGADSTNTTSGGFLYFRSAAPSLSAGSDYKSLYFPCIRVYVQGTGTVNPAPYNLDEGLVDVATYGYTRNKFSAIDTELSKITWDSEGNATFSGNVSATNFIGDGSGLTNLASAEWIEF